MTYHHKKHFSLEEARMLLPAVSAVLEEVLELKQGLDAKGYNVYRHEYFGGMGPNGQKYFPEEMERLVRLVRSLDEQGIQVKSIDEGLIDFPHLRKNGEEVYLCFKLGESDIAFWHSLEEGFPGRQTIDLL